MEALKTIWDFFQNEVLGMNWLNQLIATILNACGLDTTSKIGASVQFFIYDIDVPQEELHFKDRMKYAWEQVVSTAKKVVPYVLIGVGIGAIIHNWIPEEFIVKTLGDNNPFGVIIATIVGIPMYADIFGTIPIAEALLAKGALLGVVLSFMMGVTTLSLPSMIMLRKAVKQKLLGIFIGICSVGIIVVGYFFNAIQYLIV